MNLTCNMEKCEFNKDEVIFHGIRFSGSGITPTDDKIAAVRDAQRPNSPSETKSFLAMVNWSTQFIPNLASMCEPLRELANKHVPFDWLQKHEEAFNSVRQALVSQPLAHFNPLWYTVVYVDAGPRGLGAILTQFNPSLPENERNVVVCAYASRLQTAAEISYTHIEKETLAIEWALKKYHFYLISNNFTMVTDNKPVQYMLTHADSNVRNARIMRLMGRMSPYTGMICVYQPGSANQADYFSRNPVASTPEEQHRDEQSAKELNTIVRQIIADGVPPILTEAKIKEKTSECTTLQLLSQAIKQGISTKNTVLLHEYKDIINDILIYDGILSINGKIIIPLSLQLDLIKHAHLGHQGITKTMELLKLHVWFPNMLAKVTNTVKSCKCQSISAKTSRMPIIMTEMPAGPWKEIAIDFKGPLSSGIYWFVVVDLYSRFVFVFEVNATSFKAISPILDNLFAMFGFVDKIKSDRGPPFSSQDFNTYCKERNIILHLVTPLWPNANGSVERFNRNLVKLIQVSKITNTNCRKQLAAFLLNYRATPHTTTKVSQAMLFLNKDIQTLIPQLKINTPTQHQLPQLHNLEAELNNIISNEKVAEYANQHRNIAVHSFKVNDLVLCKIDAAATSKLRNKSLAPYEAGYKVIKANQSGSQIIIKNVLTGQIKTRNSSFLSLQTVENTKLFAKTPIYSLFNSN